MEKVNFKQLINALTNDVRTYRDLKKILQDKFEAIKSRDAVKLDETTAAHDALMRTVAANTSRRMQVLDMLTKQLFTDRKGGNRVTVTEIAALAGEADRGKLLALKAMLYKEVDQVQSLNRINNLAVKKMLGHLDFIFKAIVNFDNSNGVYSKNGTQGMTMSSGLIDAIA